MYAAHVSALVPRSSDNAICVIMDLVYFPWCNARHMHVEFATTIMKVVIVSELVSKSKQLIESQHCISKKNSRP